MKSVKEGWARKYNKVSKAAFERLMADSFYYTNGFYETRMRLNSPRSCSFFAGDTDLWGFAVELKNSSPCVVHHCFYSDSQKLDDIIDALKTFEFIQITVVEGVFSVALEHAGFVMTKQKAIDRYGRKNVLTLQYCCHVTEWREA